MAIEDEVIEALHTLESFGVSEEVRKNILLNGIKFSFGYGERDAKRDRTYNILEFASMLEAFKKMNIDIDVNAIIEKPTEYEEFITVSEGVASLKRKFSKNAQS